MSKKNMVARVGNFEITKDGGAEHEYLRIKSVSGHWGVTYRDDNEIYGKILAMCRDREYAKTLERHVVHLFYTTTIMIDEQFAMDFLISLEAMRDRKAKAQGEPTEEEENETIREMEALEDAKDLLKLATGTEN